METKCKACRTLAGIRCLSSKAACRDHCRSKSARWIANKRCRCSSPWRGRLKHFCGVCRCSATRLVRIQLKLADFLHSAQERANVCPALVHEQPALWRHTHNPRDPRLTPGGSSGGAAAGAAAGIGHIALGTDIGGSVRQPEWKIVGDVLGMELLYGGEGTGFSSLRTRDAQSAHNLRFSIWSEVKL
jgi:amidase